MRSLGKAIVRLTNLIWPKLGLKRFGKYLLRRLQRLTASPHSVAAGFAAGAAVSVFPLIGFHLMLGFALAFLTRGSMLASALGTAVGNPLTFPLFFSTTYRVGKFITPGSDIAADSMIHGDEMEGVLGTMISDGISAIWPVWVTMMIGGVPVGVLTYITSYIAVRALVVSSRKRRSSR